MPLRTTTTRRLLWGVAGLNGLGAAGLLVATLQSPPPSDAEEAQPLPPRASAATNTDEPTTNDANAFRIAAWQQPLRRPLYDPPPPVPEPPPPPPPLRLTLLGTMVQGDQRTALVRGGDGQQRLVRVGDTQDDATVTRIDAETITVEYHGETRTLTREPP